MSCVGSTRRVYHLHRRLESSAGRRSESAGEALAALQYEQTDDDRSRGTEALNAYASSVGLTTVINAGNFDDQPIVIRRSEPDDYRAIHEIHSQPNAIWGTLQIPFPSVETWRKRLAESPENLFGLVACIDGNAVGNFALFIRDQSPRRRHVDDLGLAVHDDWSVREVRF